jgi:hypothetical protein
MAPTSLYRLSLSFIFLQPLTAWLLNISFSFNNAGSNLKIFPMFSRNS